MYLAYWPYARSNVVFLLNCLPTKDLSSLSPFELLYGKSTSYDFFKAFGYFPCLEDYNKRKLEYRSRVYFH